MKSRRMGRIQYINSNCYLSCSNLTSDVIIISKNSKFFIKGGTLKCKYLFIEAGKEISFLKQCGFEGTLAVLPSDIFKTLDKSDDDRLIEIANLYKTALVDESIKTEQERAFTKKFCNFIILGICLFIGIKLYRSNVKLSDITQNVFNFIKVNANNRTNVELSKSRILNSNPGL
ncbi:MAG: hypothetical protein J0H68_05430 [Sphingobacteriia bacterium]|nr:hypothetical protein [Sphingobacteriia bacterium]